LQCEVCGRRIIGKPYKAIIEGAKMVVCGECSKLGSIRWETETAPKKVLKKPAKPTGIKLLPTKPLPKTLTEHPLELIENFGVHVRKAREGMGLSYEELGRKIGEKVSVLKKIESGKMVPEVKLARKLEHILRVKLLAPDIEPKITQKGVSPRREITLGDIVNLKKRKPEAEAR